MSFLHALPVWVFIALPLIPILLHLLTLPRLRTVELPTYRFLFDSYVQQRRRTQFLEALLAMLRVLFILAIVILISRPMISNGGGLFPAGSGRDVILLVDCSASMNTKTRGETAFQRARAVARQVVKELAKDDRVTLVRVTARPEEVFGRFATEVESIQERVDHLKLSPSRANLFAALNAIFGDEKNRPANPFVYFITDAQANSFVEIERQKELAERLLPAGTPFVLVDVGSTEQRTNIAVVGDAPPRQRAIVGLPINLQARVVNASAVEAEGVLAFFVNDKKIEEQTVKLKPNETALRRLAPYIPTEAGVLKGRFEVSLGGRGDAFPEDDRFQFSLPVQPRLKVLIVNGNSSPEPTENEAFYLKAALAVGGDTSRGKGPAMKVGSEFARALDVVDEPETAWGNLDEPRLKAKLQPYAVVILANCGMLEQYNGSAYPRLRDYVADGGGLLIFPGEKVQPESYNHIVFAVPQSENLIGARLAAFEGDPDNAATFRKLARINFDHLVFSIFVQPGKPESRYFENVYIKRRFPLTLADPRSSTVLAEYADRSPAIVEGQYGDGVVILTSFPMNATWTNLPFRIEFVPLMLQMVSHVQRRADAVGPTVVTTGAPAEFSVTSAWAPVAGKVTDESGSESELNFERSAGREVAVHERTGERGYYTITVGKQNPGKADQGKSATLGFAVNLAPEESDATRITEARVKELLPSAKVTYINQSAEAPQGEGAARTTELWRSVIWLMFLLIGAEFLLATVRGKRAASEEPARGGLTAWVGRMTGGK